MTCEKGMPSTAMMPGSDLDRGLALEKACHYAEALAVYGQVLSARPDDQQALTRYRIMLERMPDAAEGFNDLAIALADWGRIDQAADCLARAIQLSPDNADAYNNMGLLLKGQGRIHEAIHQYRKAIRIRPDYANAQWNLAISLLLTGQFSEGWQRFTWRRRADLDAILDSQRRDAPTWDGRPFQGKRLLVRYEQGMGDCLQMLRYLPLVKPLGGEVWLEAPRPLICLAQTAKGVDHVVEVSVDGTPTVEFDLHVFIMDLPGILGTTIDTIPSAIPYIYADPAKAELWRRRMAGPGLKVGIVWAGSPRHTNDKNRSCPLHYFRTLLEVPGIRWVSLQKGPARSQLDSLNYKVEDLADQIRDFSDTAAVVANLDLVISVDTAMLHLAGACARPVWALLPFVPDWRWLLDRADSPWYPQMRLFRQARPGDWTDAISATADQLRILSTEC